MVQKVKVHLEDDLDGDPAEHTISFGLDGKDYEIDLSNANAEKLPEALRPYAEAGRKSSRSTGTRTTKGDPDTAKIRAWAKESGYQVPDRGRIHPSVKDTYYAAH